MHRGLWNRLQVHYLTFFYPVPSDLWIIWNFFPTSKCCLKMAENELKMAPIFNHFTFLERLKFKHPIIAATITISDKGERSSDESAIFTTKIFQKNCQKLFFPILFKINWQAWCQRLRKSRFEIFLYFRFCYFVNFNYLPCFIPLFFIEKLFSSLRFKPGVSPM